MLLFYRLEILRSKSTASDTSESQDLKFSQTSNWSESSEALAEEVTEQFEKDKQDKQATLKRVLDLLDLGNLWDVFSKIDIRKNIQKQVEALNSVLFKVLNLLVDDCEDSLKVK